MIKRISGHIVECTGEGGRSVIAHKVNVDAESGEQVEVVEVASEDTPDSTEDDGA